MRRPLPQDEARDVDPGLDAAGIVIPVADRGEDRGDTGVAVGGLGEAVVCRTTAGHDINHG